MHSFDGSDVQRSGCPEVRQQPLGPEDLNATSGERAADQRPVRVDEAQDTVDRDLATNHLTDDLDLCEDPVDELGAVAGPDDKPFDARAQQSAFDA